MLYEKTLRRLVRTRRLAAALFVVFLLVLGPLGASTPALAGQPVKSGGHKAPPGSGYITFGIQPSGPRQPDKRTWFVYELKPGTTIEDWVAVTNFSLTPLSPSSPSPVSTVGWPSPSTTPLSQAQSEGSASLIQSLAMTREHH